MIGQKLTRYLLSKSKMSISSRIKVKKMKSQRGSIKSQRRLRGRRKKRNCGSLTSRQTSLRNRQRMGRRSRYTCQQDQISMRSIRSWQERKSISSRSCRNQKRLKLRKSSNSRTSCCPRCRHIDRLDLQSHTTKKNRNHRENTTCLTRNHSDRVISLFHFHLLRKIARQREWRRLQLRKSNYTASITRA